MSKKRRGSLPSRSERLARARTLKPSDGAPGSRSRRPVAIGAGLAGLAAVLLIGVAVVVLGAGRPAPSIGRPGSSEVAAASPSARSGSVVPSTPPGGRIAKALIAMLHRDPFIAHVDESVVARSTAKQITVTITAKAVGDVNGPDVSIRARGTGAGPATDDEIVTVGEAAWVRKTGTSAWTAYPRTAVESSVDGLRRTIQLIDDPNQLVDVGLETLDGQAVHHLTAFGTIAYRSDDGADGAYDAFDVWVTDAGIPVLAKASFSASQGQNSIIGSTDIRYSDVGGPITIRPPAGAPTLAPSAAP